MISTALEALIHTDRRESTKQFITRTGKLAKSIGLVTFGEAAASRFYDLRSSLAHGQGVGNLQPEDRALYVLGEDLLSMILKKAILEPQFAATFTDETSIKKHWAK